MKLTFWQLSGPFWVAIFATLIQLGAGAFADSTQSTAAPAQSVAIQGYDVVAYFTDGRPVMGRDDISVPFDDAKWQFANTSHRDMFAADPDKFMPQYGGMCAGGMLRGVSVPADPENWVIVEGKLYMLAGSKTDLQDWLNNAAANISRADVNWSKMRQ